jgi:hypothetical protein
MITLTSKLLQKRSASQDEAKIQVEKMRNFLTRKGFLLTRAGSNQGSSPVTWEHHHYYRLDDLEIVVWAEEDEDQDEDNFDRIWFPCWNACTNNYTVGSSPYLGHGVGLTDLVIFYNNLMEE